jgi:hypothetical protein
MQISHCLFYETLSAWAGENNKMRKKFFKSEKSVSKLLLNFMFVIEIFQRAAISFRGSGLFMLLFVGLVTIMLREPQLSMQVALGSTPLTLPCRSKISFFLSLDIFREMKTKKNMKSFSRRKNLFSFFDFGSGDLLLQSLKEL